MAHSLAHYTCCLIVLTIFIDRGDGLWKKKDKENLQYDIELFKKMADKIEHEIEDFYDEYSSKRLKEHIFESLLQKYKANIVSNASSKNLTWQHKTNSLDLLDFPVVYDNFAQVNAKSNKEIGYTNGFSNLNNIHIGEVSKMKGPRWPKFEDILLEMGKRYDWKNDRWLKVKVKLKEDNQISDNNIDVHEKHKFHYKIVKLNRSKNRRNVVVAVSAVR